MVIYSLRNYWNISMLIKIRAFINNCKFAFICMKAYKQFCANLVFLRIMVYNSLNNRKLLNSKSLDYYSTILLWLCYYIKSQCQITFLKENNSCRKSFNDIMKKIYLWVFYNIKYIIFLAHLWNKIRQISVAILKFIYIWSKKKRNCFFRNEAKFVEKV